MTNLHTESKLFVSMAAISLSRRFKDHRLLAFTAGNYRQQGEGLDQRKGGNRALLSEA